MCLDMKFNWGLLSLNLLIHQPSTLTHPQPRANRITPDLTYHLNRISACSFTSTLKVKDAMQRTCSIISVSLYGPLDSLKSHAARRDSSSTSQYERSVAAQTNKRVTLAALRDAAVAHSSSTSCEILLLNWVATAADKTRRSVLTCVTVQTCIM